MAARLLSVVVLGLAAADSPAVFPVLVAVPRLDAEGVPLPREAIRRFGPGRSLADGSVVASAFTADGRHIITISDVLTLRKATDLTVVWRKPIGGFSSAAIVPAADGRTAWAIGFNLVDPQKYQFETLHFSLTDGTVLARKTIDSQWSWTYSITATGRFVTLTQNLAQASVFDPGVRDPVAEWACAGFGNSPGATLSPDGKSLAVCAVKPRIATDPPVFSVQIVDVASRAQRHDVPAPGVGDLRYAADGRTLFALCEVNSWAGNLRPPATILAIDPAVGMVKARFTIFPDRNPNNPHHLWPSPDGSAVAVTGWGDWPLSVYDVPTGKLRFRIPSVGYGSVSFSPDGKVLAVGGFNLSLWDAQTGRRLPSSPPTERGYGHLTFAADGRTLTATPDSLSDVTTWDVRTGRELERLPWDEADRRGMVPRSIWHASGMPRTARSATGLVARTLWAPEGDPRHNENGDVVVRDGPAGREIARFRLSAAPRDELHFTPDGRRLITRNDEAVEVWDIRTEKRAFQLPFRPRPEGGSARMNSWVYPSPTSRHVAVHEVNAQTPTGLWSVGVYELEAGKEVKRFEGTGLLHALTWSADGNRLAGIGSPTGAENGFVFVGDLTTSRPPCPQTAIPGPSARAVALSADGKTLAVSPDGDIHLLDVATGAIRHTFPGHSQQALALGFSHDGRVLASAGTGGPVLLWDVAGELSRPTAAPDPAALDRAWADLAGEPVRAFRAERLLTAYPELGLPLLKRRFAAEPAPDPAEIAKLIARLDAPNFADREKATAGLKALGDAARPALRKAVAETTSAETRARAERLLATPPETGPDRLRIARAVEAVERTGTPAATALLKEWGRGSNGRLADEADAALHRRGDAREK